MKELSKEELSKYIDEEIKFTEGMIKHCKLNTPKEWIERHQAMLQIKQLISQSERQVDEEYINEKHEAWVNGYWKLPSRAGVVLFEYTKEFIRSIVSEIQKPSGEKSNGLDTPIKFIKAIRKKIEDYPPVADLLLKDFLDILKERERRIKKEEGNEGRSSMTTPAVKAKSVWIELLMERFPDEFQKLYQVRFGEDGKMREDRNYKYVKRHFPHLVEEWEERVEKG